MARGRKLDIEFCGFGDGWEADNKEKPESGPKETLPPPQHCLVMQREKRRGKPVTLAGEFFLSKEEEKALLGRVKKMLGCGGTLKEGWLEVQGDKAVALRHTLEAEGFRFKK
ncbi:translation initiation factor [Hydrogenimonas sp.]